MKRKTSGRFPPRLPQQRGHLLVAAAVHAERIAIPRHADGRTGDTRHRQHLGDIESALVIQELHDRTNALLHTGADEFRNGTAVAEFYHSDAVGRFGWNANATVPKDKERPSRLLDGSARPLPHTEFDDQVPMLLERFGQKTARTVPLEVIGRDGRQTVVGFQKTGSDHTDHPRRVEAETCLRIEEENLAETFLAPIGDDRLEPTFRNAPADLRQPRQRLTRDLLAHAGGLGHFVDARKRLSRLVDALDDRLLESLEHLLAKGHVHRTVKGKRQFHRAPPFAAARRATSIQNELASPTN